MSEEEETFEDVLDFDGHLSLKEQKDKVKQYFS